MVNDASSFCSAAKEVSNVNVVHVNSAIINSANSKLNTSKLFEDAPTIKRIKTFHCVQFKDSESQLFQLTKTAKESPVLVNDNGNDISVSSWCVVEYNKMLFPGEVQGVDGNNYEVSVMVEVGKYWKWPSREDKIFYHKDQIRKVLQPPTLINSREHYHFPDF